MPHRPRFDVEEVKADTTPMIDVVFLLIVFFVCVDFRVLEAKLPAYLPRDRGLSPSVVLLQEVLPVRIEVVTPGVPVREAAPGAKVVPGAGRPPRYRLQDHRVAWQIGPRRFTDLAAARRELERLARDPTLYVVDRETGGRRPMDCLVEGQRGSRYDDVAKAADACRAAGFTEVHLGAGEGLR